MVSPQWSRDLVCLLLEPEVLYSGLVVAYYYVLIYWILWAVALLISVYYLDAIGLTWLVREIQKYTDYRVSLGRGRDDFIAFVSPCVAVFFLPD